MFSATVIYHWYPPYTLLMLHVTLFYHPESQRSFPSCLRAPWESLCSKTQMLQWDLVSHMIWPFLSILSTDSSPALGFTAQLPYSSGFPQAPHDATCQE